MIGAGEASESLRGQAYRLGSAIGESGFVLVCGGLGGVMEAASRGCFDSGGVTVGVLPGDDRALGNPYLTVAIPTGFSHGRNYLVVKAGDGVIAVGGGAGTLSEIGLALKLGRPTVLLDSLDVEASGIADPNLSRATTPAQALRIVKTRIK